MKILVTGHKGFIGSHLVKSLDEYVGLDLKDGYDITDCELPEADIVIHLAAQAGVVKSVENPHWTVKNNVLGTIRLMQHYKNAKFIFASTGGAIQDEILSPYGLSKYHCEEYLKMLHDNTVILRFANVYGEGSRSVVDKFIKEDINIWGDGSQTRTFVHVDDLVRGIKKAINWPSGSYYFGGDQNYTIKELAEATGKKITYTDWKEGELKHSSLENTTPDWDHKHDVIEYIKQNI